MSLAENLPALAKLAKGVLPDWKSIFDETSPSGRFHVEGSKTGTKDGRRTFASGLTKVLWFAGAHTLPMFDSNTSEAVGARGRDKAAQAIDFYKKLEEDDWSVEQAVDVISEAAATVKLDWDFFPERFLDKLLFVKSLMNKEGFESRFLFAASMNRTAYLSTLQRAEAVNLNLLADRLSQKVTCLPKNWALNPCPPNSPSSPSPVSYRSCNPC